MDNVALQTEPQPTGPFSRLAGIFFQPRQTFEDINRRPTWAVVLILTILISLVGTLAFMNLIGFENIMDQQIRDNPRMQEMTEEQRAMMLDSPFMRFSAYLGALVGVPVIALLTSVLLMLLFWVSGAEAPFAKFFSVVIHSFFAYSVVSMVLSVLIVLLAPDRAQLDVTNLVASNLGVLVARADSPVLHTVLSSLDVLTFYYLFLLSLGLSVVSRKTVGSAAFLVVALWAFYVALKAGWAAVTGF
jgi:uncharacterized protein YneF (UPF0154 family)